MEQISSLLAAAAVGGFAITAVAGKFMIPALHRLHFGQTIREEGPTWHSKKNGTPTMGGLCFILGILATLGIVWVMYSPKLPEVLGMPQLQAGMLVLFLAFGSGLIGFLDDFIKVIRHRNLGLTEAQKMILQIALTFGFMFGLHSLGLDGLDGESAAVAGIRGAAEFILTDDGFTARGAAEQNGLRQWSAAADGGGLEYAGARGYRLCCYSGGGQRVDTDYYSNGRIRCFILTHTDGSETEYIAGRITG